MLACFSINSTSIDLLLLANISWLFSSRLADIQTYYHAAILYEVCGDRRTVCRLIIGPLGQLPSKGDPKKDGKRSKPAKPPKPRIKKQKSEREGDKEKQEENEPRSKCAVEGNRARSYRA
jgi:hypothetical protein